GTTTQAASVVHINLGNKEVSVPCSLASENRADSGSAAVASILVRQPCLAAHKSVIRADINDKGCESSCGNGVSGCQSIPLVTKCQTSSVAQSLQRICPP